MSPDPDLPPGHTLNEAARTVARAADPALAGAETDELLASARHRPNDAGHRHGRWQDALIEEDIPRGAAVLDLGCGTGELLARLVRDRGVRGQGIEVDPEAVRGCVARGVPVLESDLDEGLRGFPDGVFDYVILEQTLQTLRRPVEVLSEMLRVGTHGIVSFPNFGYWRVRLQLALEGRMPETRELPYHWHDTPNIHLFSIRDFLDWTAQAGVSIVKACAFEGGRARPLRGDDNLHAEEALFFVGRS